MQLGWKFTSYRLSSSLLPMGAACKKVAYGRTCVWERERTFCDELRMRKAVLWYGFIGGGRHTKSWKVFIKWIDSNLCRVRVAALSTAVKMYTPCVQLSSSFEPAIALHILHYAYVRPRQIVLDFQPYVFFAPNSLNNAKCVWQGFAKGGSRVIWWSANISVMAYQFWRNCLLL